MAQSNLDDSIPQVTLVVLGAQGVGKSTFIQNSFDMRSPSPSALAVKKMSLGDMVYLVQLVEMSLDAIVITESNRIKWPKSLKGVEVPPVDGVLALYDVTNQQSINGIPDLLRWSPIQKPPLPYFLFRPLNSASYPLLHAKSRPQNPLHLMNHTFSCFPPTLHR
jgi:hypothetical protein